MIAEYRKILELINSRMEEISTDLYDMILLLSQNKNLIDERMILLKENRELSEEEAAAKTEEDILIESGMHNSESNYNMMQEVFLFFIESYFNLHYINNADKELKDLNWGPKTLIYDKKKDAVRQINWQLRQYDLAIQHPETHEPCLLLGVNSRDSEGRFTLESRVDKKRLGSYRTLKELLPMKLVKDVPRREGFLTKRNENQQTDDENI